MKLWIFFLKTEPGHVIMHYVVDKVSADVWEPKEGHPKYRRAYVAIELLNGPVRYVIEERGQRCRRPAKERGLV